MYVVGVSTEDAAAVSVFLYNLAFSQFLSRFFFLSKLVVVVGRPSEQDRHSVRLARTMLLWQFTEEFARETSEFSFPSQKNAGMKTTLPRTITNCPITFQCAAIFSITSESIESNPNPNTVLE